MRDTFHDRLKELRQEKKLTLKQVADELDISTSILWDYEQADKDDASKPRKMPGMEILIKLANLYGVSTDYLCCLTGARKPKNADLVDNWGLSEAAVKRLKRWKTKKNRLSESSKEFAHMDAILRFINELICSPRIDGIVADADAVQEYLNLSIESLQDFVNDPERIRTEINLARGDTNDPFIEANIDSALLCETRAKDLFGDFIAGSHWVKLRKLQRELRALCKELASAQ